MQEASRYRWDERVSRFRDTQTGRLVAESTVRVAIDQYISGHEREMVNTSKRLREKEITPAEWRQDMARLIKQVHIGIGAAASGGWLQMTQADYGRVGAEVRRQYEYLDRFAQQIVNGKQPLDGTVQVRAMMYAESARGFYYDQVRRLRGLRGKQQERRRLNPADHCGDCVRYADMGWVAIGTLPPPGRESVCRTFCKCEMDFR